MIEPKALTVLLIEDNPDYAALVPLWLSPQDDIEFVVNWANSPMAGLIRVAKGGVDVILLDPGLPDSHGLETFTSVRMHASGIPIVILSADEKQSLALQMVQQGAQDYIVKSTCDSKLLVKTLRYAVGRSSHPVSEYSEADRGTVIGVMGAKGGVGATTVACNLAIELRRQTDQSVLLGDLDVNTGLVGFLMNTQAKFSVLDAVADIHRLDNPLWKGMVPHGPEGVDIMQSPRLMGVDSAAVCKIQVVLGLIRKFYRWTVLDLGRMTSLSVSLLEKINELYLVTMLSVPALHETKRTVEALRKAGLADDRLRLIVNQAGTTRVSGDDLIGLFGLPLYGKLPGAAEELDDACARGKLPGRHSHYGAQLALLARKIAGLPNEKAGGAASQLRSFAGMFR
jgi:pilus assembly protein CpaE